MSVPEIRAVLPVGDVDQDLDLAAVPTQFLPEMLEEVEEFVAGLEERLAPARAHIAEIRAEIERRMDAENASILKCGDHVMRFERIAPRSQVRTSMLADPGVLDELRAVLPLEIFEKAIAVEEIPARLEYRTNLTHLKKLLDAGERGVRLFSHLVDRGVERRRLVITREQQRVASSQIASGE